MRSIKEKKGITLIALAVTIVVILILAAISIGIMLNDDGVINKAKEAANSMNNDIDREQSKLNELLNELDEVMNDAGDEGTDDRFPTTVAEAKIVKIYFDTNTKLKDDYNNDVWIPKGFKVPEDSGTKVEEGVVIEDYEGNQFVWIPTGEYKNSSGKSKINNLTRRIFLKAGPQEINGDDLIGYYYYGEGNINSCIYGTDYDISSFKESNSKYGGFYIGRFESGCINDRVSPDSNLEKLYVKKGLYPYTNLKKNEAIELSQDMYKSNNEVKSTLISSYAYDTALNFICQNSNYGYSLALVNDDKSLANVGSKDGENKKYKTGEYGKDCYSNIYDFLGNVYEWSTEYSSDVKFESVFRGNGYKPGVRFPALRDYSNNDLVYESRGFRVQLYLQ